MAALLQPEEHHIPDGPPLTELEGLFEDDELWIFCPIIKTVKWDLMGKWATKGTPLKSLESLMATLDLETTVPLEQRTLF
jgi:hypothetical protein